MQLMPGVAAVLLVSSVAWVTASSINKTRILQELSVAVAGNDFEAVHRLTEQLRTQVPEPKAPSPSRTLQELTGAVARNDGDAVHRLTEQLRTQVPKSAPIRTISELVPELRAAPPPSNSLASNSSVVNVTRSFLSAHKQDGRAKEEGESRRKEEENWKELERRFKLNSAFNADVAASNSTTATVTIPPPPHIALFDDSIFAITPARKAELGAELLQPNMANAVEWIKTGGWYNCAYENEMCHCVGKVRYGYPHTKTWSAPQDIDGSIHCSSNVFGGDVKPGKPKECHCHRAAFHLEKRETSSSILQESFIFLLRLLAMTKLLPTGTGDRRYHGMELWSARHWGQPGGCLERYWIDKYISDAQPHVPGFRCLEWGVHYTNYYPQCTEKWTVKYEPVKYQQVLPHVAGGIQTVFSDIYSFPMVLGTIQFNFIMATQLFEHLERPFEAAKSLFEVVAPGGAVLYTGPQQAQFHMVPADYLRYTKMEVKYIFEQAGFCVPPHMMAGSGDFIFDAARNMGLQVQDFTNEELDEGYQFGYDNIAEGAITIHAMIYKPPHAACGR